MGAKVVVNVYDLSPQNQWTYWCGVGIFHTGVEVYGIEYAYGGHDYNFSGIFATNPRDAPGHAVFRQSIMVGETDLDQHAVQQVIHQLGQTYKGNRYHLLQRNCNNFTSELCEHLVGRAPPGWINRLADLAISVHCLLPPSWVPPLQAPAGKVEPQHQQGNKVLVHAPVEEIMADLQKQEEFQNSATTTTRLANRA